MAHPYRDSSKRMSPMWFDRKNDLSYMLDLTTIRYMVLLKDGTWDIYWKHHGEAKNFPQESGTRLYNALRAYSESHYE